MGRLTRFGVGLTGSYDFEASGIYQQNLQVNFGGRVRASERVVMASGGFDKYGVSSSPAEVGTITLELILRAETREAMEDMREDLAAIQGYGLNLLKYQETDEAEELKFCYARCTNVSIPQDVKGHSDLFQRANVSFEVPNPIWHTSGKAGATWGSTFVWGQSIWGGDPDVIAASGTLTNATITNNGKAPTLPVIRVACGPSQTCEDVTIQRIVNGAVVDQVDFYDTVGNNEAVIIHCRKRSVLHEGVEKIDYIDFLHPSWFRILPGSNAIRVRFANAGDAAEVSIAYYENFYGA